MGGIYLTADTFTAEKEHFSSGWNNKQGTWLGVEKLAQSETVYWIRKTPGSGQWLDHPIGSLKGRSEIRWSDAKAVDWHMGACKVWRFLHHMLTTTSVMENICYGRSTEPPGRHNDSARCRGPSLVTTQLAWWTRAEWSRWLMEVQQQGCLFTKAHLLGLLWQVTLDQGLTTGLAEIVLELHCSLKTFPM